MSLHTILPELGEASEGLPALVAEMECKVPYASALLSRNSGLQVTVSDREQSVSEIAPSQGVVLSAWNGAYFEEAASSDLTRQCIFSLAHDLADGVKRVSSDTNIDPGPTLRAHYATPCVQDPTTMSAKDKLSMCLDLHARTRKLDPRIVNVQVRYAETLEAKVFANHSRHLTQNVLRLRLTVTVFVSDGRQLRYDWMGKDVSGGLELVQFSDEELHELCQNTLALLSAEKIPGGIYDVLCSPDVSGVIAHEAFGHGVELDMFLKERARSRQYLGQSIATPLVDILDDPSYPQAYGHYFFDDEGQLASPTYIIRKGVFERGLSDLISAHRLNVLRSANGRRESFERKVYARMSNTFFARGSTPTQQMLESIERGVYLQHTSSGMEDPKGWGMQVTSHYGQEIMHGKLTGRIFAPIGITGYVPDILQSVTAVGDDFRLTGGTCGKGHKEWVPVSSGGPHLRLKARLG